MLHVTPRRSGQISEGSLARHVSWYTGFGRGVLAAGGAILVLLTGSALSGQPGVLEVVADGATRAVPLPVFESILAALGALAKGILFSAVAAGALLAGGVLGVLFRRAVATFPVGAAITVVAASSVALAGAMTWVASGAPFALGTAYDPGAVVTPLVLASATYAVLLVILLQPALEFRTGVSPAGPGEPDEGAPSASTPAARQVFPRRVLLARIAALAGGAALLGAAAAISIRILHAAKLSGATSRSLNAGQAGFGPTAAVTPVPDFYVVLKDLSPPVVDGATWRLVIDGLVDHPLELSLAELRTLPSLTAYRTLECISYTITIPNDLISNQLWRGVPVADLLDAAGSQRTARWVLWTAADGYTESLPLPVARDPETWIAYEMGGAPLTADHGFPARILVAGRFGMKQPKWVTRLTVASSDRPGFWEQNGWDEQALIRSMSRIDTPQWRETVQTGVPFATTGIAFAGDGGISRVEVSADDARTWQDAILEASGRAPLDRLTWVRWRAILVVDRPGPAMLVVRATDGHGTTQSGVYADAPPAGSAGWDRVGITALS